MSPLVNGYQPPLVGKEAKRGRWKPKRGGRSRERQMEAPSEVGGIQRKAGEARGGQKSAANSSWRAVGHTVSCVCQQGKSKVQLILLN